MKTLRKDLKLVFIVFWGLNVMQLNAQEDYILDFDISTDIPHYLTSTKFFGLSFRNPYCSNFKLTEIGAHIDSTSSSGVVKFALYNNLNVDHRELLWESGEVAVTGGVNEYVYADIPEGDIVLEDMHFYIIAMIGNPDGDYIKVKKKIAPENNGVAINHSNSTAGQYTNINYPDFPDSTHLQIAWYGAVNMVAKGVPDFVTITPNELSLDTLKGECVTVTDFPTAIASCGGTISATTKDPLEYHHDGVYNITWTFKKGYYYAVEQVQTVVVDDITAPEIPTLPDVSSICSVVLTPPTTTDACTGTITGKTTDDTIYTELGDYDITWTFDDGNGNSAQAIQHVTVIDTIAPDMPVLSDLTGVCSLTVPIPTTTDACAGTITGTTIDDTTYTELGDHTITWIFDDGNGNSVQATQHVTVIDTIAPNMPVLSDLIGECSLTVPIPTTTDACAGTITGTTTDNTTFTELGDYTITWTFDDGNGNSVQATQHVTIIDTVAPEMPVLSDMTGNCSLTVPAPTITDACAGTITGTTTDDITFTELGDYTITWTFDDGNGNSVQADQNITIDDAVPPTIMCISNQTINLSGDTTSYSIKGNEFDPVASDNCGIDSIFNDINNSSTLEGITLATGTTTITWVVIDKAGNQVECSHDIVVETSTLTKKYKTEGDFLLFPNPTTGKILIKSSNIEIKEIVVTDISGVVQLKYPNLDKMNTLNLSGLKNGVYIIYIKTEKNTYNSSIIKMD